MKLPVKSTGPKINQEQLLKKNLILLLSGPVVFYGFSKSDSNEFSQLLGCVLCINWGQVTLNGFLSTMLQLELLICLKIDEFMLTKRKELCL